MSQINIQSLLNPTPIGPNVQPSPTAPNYKSSEFSGGNVKLGQAAQQIGPSGEESMYKSLAQIAGGLESGLDAFGKISQLEEQKKIRDAQVEMDRIDQSEDTPDEKMAQLDEIMKNTWTPMSGDGWRNEMSVSAGHKWMTREARNVFEEKRYNGELASFLREPRNVGHSYTPELERIFQNEYASKFPTSLSTDFFTVKQFQVTGVLHKQIMEDSMAMLEMGIKSAFPMPTDPQLQQIISGDTELRSKFPAFFDKLDQARLSTPEGFARTIQEMLTKDVLAGAVGQKEGDVPPEAMQRLAREVPRISLEMAKEWTIKASEFTKDSIKTGSERAQQLALTRFESAEDVVASSHNLLSSTFTNGPKMIRSREDRLTLVQNVLTKISTGLDDAITGGRGEYLAKKFPGWSKMTAYQRVEAGITLFSEWLDSNPDNADKVFNTMLFTEEEMGGEPFKTQEEAKAFLIRDMRMRAITSKEVQRRINSDINSIKDSVTAANQNLSVYTEQTGLDQGKTKIQTGIADYLGVSHESLLKAFLDDGSPKPLRDLPAWEASLSEEERKRLRARGHTLDNFATAEVLISLAQATHQAALTVSQKPKFGSTASMFDKDAVYAGMRKFNPSLVSNANMVDPSLVVDLHAGRAFENDANAPFLILLNQYRDARDYVARKDPQVNQTLQTKQKEFIASVDKEFREMTHFATSLDRADTEMLFAVSEIASTLPSPGQNRGADPKVVQAQAFKEASTYIRRVNRGERIVNLMGDLRNPIDSDGSWSPEATGNLVQLQLLTRRSVMAGAHADDKKMLNTLLDSTLTRLAQGDTYLASHKGKYDLAVLSVIGKEFKRGMMETGVTPEMSPADYIRRRWILLGNWADATNVPELFAKLSDPQSLASRDAGVRVLLGQADITRRSKQIFGVYDETRGDSVYRQTVYNNTVTGLAGSIASQPLYAVSPQGEQQAITTIGPSDSRWDPGLFVTGLNSAFGKKGVTYTATDVVDNFIGLLSSIPSEHLNKMTEDDKLRAIAQIIVESTGTNEGLLSDALELILGDQGMNAPGLMTSESREVESPLMLFSKMLGATLDMRYEFNYNPHGSNTHMGVSPINRSIISRGLISETIPAGTTTVDGKKTTEDRVISKVGLTEHFSIYGPKPENTWSGAVIGNYTSSARVFQFTGNALQDLLKAHRPSKYYNPTTKKEEGQTDGVFHTIGAMTLAANIPGDPEAVFSIVAEWAKAHGINNLKKIAEPRFPRNFDGTAGPSILSPAERALKNTLNMKDISLQEFLEELNSSYIALGGTNPLWDPETYRPSAEGFAELDQTQGNPSNPASMLPTFKHSRRSIDGVPYISLNDAYFFETVQTERGPTRESRGILEGYMAKSVGRAKSLEKIKADEDKLRKQQRIEEYERTKIRGAP